MTAIFLGTDGGVYRLDAVGSPPDKEDGPSAVNALAAGADALYALDGARALWCRDPGGIWSIVNQQPVVDEIWSFAADPVLPGRLYLGVAPALLHVSDDGGRTWAARESVRAIPGYERWTFPPPPHIPHVRSIAPDPAAPGALYIGVEEGGVYHSPDDGETWTSLNERLYWDVHVVVPPGDGSGRLFATTGGGFYRSDDGGQSWRRSMTGIDRGYTVPLLAAPGGRLYTAAAAGPPPAWGRGANAALYRSDDTGDTWTRETAGLPDRIDAMIMSLALGPENRIYAAAGSTLWAGGDGVAWQAVASDLPPIRNLAVGPVNQRA